MTAFVKMLKNRRYRDHTYEMGRVYPMPEQGIVDLWNRQKAIKMVPEDEVDLMIHQDEIVQMSKNPDYTWWIQHKNKLKTWNSETSAWEIVDES